MLALKRVDFTIEDELAGQYFIKELQLKSIVVHLYKLFNGDVSIMFSRAKISVQFIEEINIIIEQNHQVFLDIRKSYLMAK